jgi:hypothetical protein
VKPPPPWTAAQLDADRRKASAEFSRERFEEPLEIYLEAFDRCQGHIEELLETTVDLSEINATSLDLSNNVHLIEALRYLAAPPISEDDLKILADVPSLSKASLRRSPELAQKLIDVVRETIDRRRFVWVSENREPIEAERNAAIMASAALMAANRTQTLRRTQSKNQQEAMVKEALRGLGFTEVAARTITNISQAPDPGTFCGESTLGNRKGDIVVRLWDLRVMPIECKVSNSATNSVKRLNNDAAAKAESWKKDLGALQIVPTAVLSGVYKLHNLEDAQGRGLSIFWAHDLAPLTEWINSTKP